MENISGAPVWHRGPLRGRADSAAPPPAKPDEISGTAGRKAGRRETRTGGTTHPNLAGEKAAKPPNYYKKWRRVLYNCREMGPIWPPIGRCDRVNYRPTARKGPPRLTKHIFCIIRVQGSSVAFVCADWGALLRGLTAPPQWRPPGNKIERIPIQMQQIPIPKKQKPLTIKGGYDTMTVGRVQGCRSTSVSLHIGD